MSIVDISLIVIVTVVAVGGLAYFLYWAQTQDKQ